MDLQEFVFAHPIYISWKWWNECDSRFEYVPKYVNKEKGFKLVIRCREKDVKLADYERKVLEMVDKCPSEHSFAFYECWFNSWQLF